MTLDSLVAWFLILIVGLVAPLVLLVLGIILVRKYKISKSKFIVGLILVIVAAIYFIWLTIEIVRMINIKIVLF